jgi:uncharacterized protein (DUF362 family)
MAKGVSIKFKSYSETVPALLETLNLSKELKKHNKIIILPSISEKEPLPVGFIDAVLSYSIKNKNPVAEVLIAAGAEGIDTLDVFNSLGYSSLSEKHNIGIVDLNNSEVEEFFSPDFIKFEKIFFPKILKESFVISLSNLTYNDETEINGSIPNMLSAFPTKHYKGLFTQKKTKIRKFPIKYSIHDINLCKTPNLAILDTSERGILIAGQPLEVDKHAAKLLGRDWKTVPYIRIISDSNEERQSRQPTPSASLDLPKP